MTLTENLTAIADAIREKTGKSEPLTPGQMAAEIAGIQSGGASGIYMAKMTPAENLGATKIRHNLGTTDILLACCWPETLGDVVPTFDGVAGSFWFKTDIPNVRGGNNLALYAKYNSADSYIHAAGVPNSTQYFSVVIDENTFEFERASSAASLFYAGVTYTIVIIAASAFSAAGGV